MTGSIISAAFCLILTQVLSVLWISVSGSGTITVEIVTIGNIYLNSAGALPVTAPAMDTAVEELQRTYADTLNFSHVYLFDHHYVNCFELATGVDEMLGQWYYNKARRPKNLTVLIFPGCSELYSANILAAGWNMFMLTTGGSLKILRNKTLSPTWVTGACLPLPNIITTYINLLQMFNWTTIYLVLDLAATTVYQHAAEDLVQEVPLRINGSQISLVRINSSQSVRFESTLNEFYATSRVLIFLGNGGPLRKLMLAAHNLSMTNGEFVYVAMETFESPLFGSFSWKYDDGNDDRARQAYRSLLLLGSDSSIYDVPSENLTQEWRRRSASQFNVSYNRNPVVTATYTSILMFGKVLNETLRTDPTFDLANGASFAGKFFNRTVDLNYTEIFIDPVGERSTNMVIRDLDYLSGTFIIKLFQDKRTSILTPLMTIDWGTPDGGSPPNKPPCGYLAHKTLCNRTDSTLFALIFVPVGLILAGLVSFAFFNIRYGLLLSNQANWWTLEAVELSLVSDLSLQAR